MEYPTARGRTSTLLERLPASVLKPMADLIALHWGPDEVTAVVPAKGRDVRAVSLGAPPAAGDAASTGRWLKAQLAEKRLAAKRAAITLPRSAAVFRKLTLPGVPDADLPDLVRMQAATKSSTPLDRLRLDYVPLPKRGEGREALLATIPAKSVDELLAAVRGAGLEPAAIGLSPFGIAARIAADDPSTLIVAVQGSSVEITLVRDATVVLAHATELQGGTIEEDQRWLPGEVTRAVVAADHLAAGGGISRVVLVGSGPLLEPLVPAFATRYGGRVDLFDEPAKLDVTSADAGVSPAALAAAAGQLDAGHLARIDFLSPRKRVEKPDRRRLQASLAGGGVVAAAVIAYLLSWMTLNDLTETENALVTQKGDLAAVLKRGAPTLSAHKKVSSWLADRADLVEQFAAIDAALPGTERVYLKEFKLESSQRGTAASATNLGKLTASGDARTRYDVEGVSGQLAAAGYLIDPKPITSSRDAQYPADFNLILTIPRPKPPEPVKKSAATDDAAPTRPAA